MNLIWKLRGFDSFHNSKDCIQALYAIIKYGQNLERLINHENTEEEIKRIIQFENLNDQDEEKILKIRKVYKEFFYSDQAKFLITDYREARDAVIELKNKDIQQAIFTNTSENSVKRDLLNYDISAF